MIWPIVTLLMFQLMPSRRAIIWSVLAAYMLLPVRTSFDAPGLPSIDKTVVGNIAMLMAALLFARHKVIALPRQPVLLGLMALYILSPMLTAYHNREPLILSSQALPGMTAYDGLSLCVRQLIELVPFLVGYSALRRADDAREMLVALVVAGLIYVLPIVYEVRMGPVLNIKLYGFFPHSFIQQVRDGGFRPVVFMGHGLMVAIFVAMTFVAAVGLWRQRARIRGMSGAAYAGILFVMLILCKSLGAMMLGILAGAMSYFLRYRRTLSILSITGLIIVAYPALRGAGIIPIQGFADMVADFNADRAGSLQTRIHNENMLLEKAAQRPVFGWGSWGRNRVYGVDWTGYRAVDITIVDGTWIAVIGVFGWVGYIGTFGLLAFPSLRAFRYRRDMMQFPSFVALFAVLIVNLCDLIPNSSLTPVTWLLAGALSGFERRRNRPAAGDNASEPAGTAGAAPSSAPLARA